MAGIAVLPHGLCQQQDLRAGIEDHHQHMLVSTQQPAALHSKCYCLTENSHAPLVCVVSVQSQVALPLEGCSFVSAWCACCVFMLRRKLLAPSACSYGDVFLPCSMAIMGIAFLHFQVTCRLAEHASSHCQEMHCGAFRACSSLTCCRLDSIWKTSCLTQSCCLQNWVQPRHPLGSVPLETVAAATSSYSDAGAS